ncbi:MAG: hypothetical protein INR62_05425 [Rhodospirillales bacterium]|nr:hypothetical protein [Acetobacter sp.]
MLLRDTERNQKRMEALQRDYTYHVHTDVATLDKQGGLKRTESEDAESLTLNGVRVDKVTAKNGRPLSPEEQQKESERIDKAVAKAAERRSRALAKGESTDESGQTEVTLSRILELGSFSKPRRVDYNGRPTLLLEYTGDPKAKTRNPFENAFRELTGTVWIDEADRVLVRGQGMFVRDFKLGGGLLVDLHKGTSFDFQAHRIADGIWLPGTVDANGTARVFLLVNFRGRMRQTASDYKRFHASATIVGSHGAVGPDGEPLSGNASPASGKDTGQATQPHP